MSTWKVLYSSLPFSSKKQSNKAAEGKDENWDTFVNSTMFFLFHKQTFLLNVPWLFESEFYKSNRTWTANAAPINGVY